MKMPKKIAVGVAGIAVVALALALASPRAVHAIVSTLVTVANTSANPVQVREVNNSVDELFAIALCSGNNSNCGFAESLGGLPTDSGSSFTVSNVDASGNAVEALVIDYVSGVCSGPTPGLKRQSAVDPLNGQSQIVNFFNPITSSNSGAEPIFSQPVHITIPPNSAVSVFDPADSGACYMTINGHYVAQTTKPL